MNNVGTLNENTLHNQLKKHYTNNPEYAEIKVGNHYIDAVRDNELIEVQTGGFSSIKKKLAVLLKNYEVRLVYPIPHIKKIRLYGKNKKEVIHERRSPKKGTLLEAVHELIYIPHVIPNPNLTLEIVMTHEIESRCKDGKGSWRRGGVSILNRELIDILDTYTFTTVNDYKILLPNDLPETFTNKYLREKKGLSYGESYKLTNFLRKIDVLNVKEKRGRTLVYEVGC